MNARVRLNLSRHSCVQYPKCGSIDTVTFVYARHVSKTYTVEVAYAMA